MTTHQTVLLVDDDPSIHRLVERRLQGLGIELHNVYSGLQAIETAETVAPDLILLDVNMPDGNGYDIIRRLKEHGGLKDVPVIFLTARNNTEDKVRGLELGAMDYVTKPFEPAELEARARAALRTKGLLDLLRTQVQVDGLSELRNRRYFDDRLHRDLAAGIRYDRTVGLLMVDIDHFKRINDEHGHPTGDQVIRKVAEVLRDTVRTSDEACRYGGEEFAIILADTDVPQALHTAERVCAQIREREDVVQVLGRPVTVSIGASVAQPSGKLTADALIAEADRALYEAKNGGRDRAVLAKGAVERST